MINAKEVRNKLTFFEMIKDIKWRYVILLEATRILVSLDKR